ncbi:uncharacterized protein [Oryza sativa Japonica Group]|uniref:uncharacterized protein n=1 Tax=Oryza sativa subsp. japonica TaxID=39947 RepID=UPI0007755DB1|nr:uncharacterized protein LOC107280099 [Oryza sativa Japonica Group]
MGGRLTAACARMKESNASVLRCLYRRHASCTATAAHVRHPTSICSGGGRGACVDGGSRIKILCSFGGRIMPCPSDDALKYIDSETRILAVPRSIPFSPRADLKKKVEEMFRTEVAVVAEDLDVLVSVTWDEDLTHMLDEYDCSKEKRSPSASPRFRVYIFSSHGSACTTTAAPVPSPRRRRTWGAIATTSSLLRSPSCVVEKDTSSAWFLG